MIRDIKKIVKFCLGLSYSIFVFRNVRIFLNNHLTRGLRYIHKKRVKFPHPIGIVIGFNVELGDDCIIYQNVTIGTKDSADQVHAKYPVIGDRVTIYPNCVIVGDIKIGDGATIGAGSVVISDVEPYSVVAGVPAKKIK